MKKNVNVYILSKKLTSSPGSPGLPYKQTLRNFFKIMNKPAEWTTDLLNTFMEVVGSLLFLPWHQEGPLSLETQVDLGGHLIPAVKADIHHCIMSSSWAMTNMYFTGVRIIIKPIITYSGSRRSTVSLLSLYPHSWFTLHYKKVPLSTRQRIIQLPSASITYR